MSFSRLIFNEIKRLKSSYLVYFFMLLTVIAPAFGFYSMQFTQLNTANTLILLSPVKTGAVFDSILFGIFTVYEMDRIFRYNMAGIFETCTDIKEFNVAKVISIFLVAIISVTSVCILYLPYSIYRMSKLFNFNLYIKSYFLIMLPAILFGILISSGIYMITKRIDASFLLYAGFVFISLNTDRYIAAWIQTCVSSYSDCFGNSFAINTTLWNRLFWFLISFSIFLLGLVCSRRYEKNILCSAFLNSKRSYIVLIMTVFFITAYAVFINEPFYDNTPDIKHEMIAQKDSKTAISESIISTKGPDDSINLLKTFADISINVKNRSIQGQASYSLENTEQKSKDMNLAINPGYSVLSVKINGKAVPVEDLKKTQMNNKYMKVHIPAEKNLLMEITYAGKPRQNRILQSKFFLSENMAINSDYIYLAGSSLIPSPLAHSGGSSGEEYNVSGRVTLPSALNVISSGRRAVKISENGGRNCSVWSFSGKGNETITAGKYNCKEIKAGGMKVEFYYSPNQEDVVNKIGASQIIKEAVNYFTDSYGELEYANTNVPLNVVEVASSITGGWAAENICNISESTFESSTFFNPSRIEQGLGGNAAEVLIHEICHQWWGINVKVTTQLPWSPEGITVYSTYKFLQHKYGAKYAYNADMKGWESSLESLKRNFYYRNPEYMDVIPEKYLFGVLSTENSTVIYDEMPLQICKAEHVLGEKKFQFILKKIFRRYKNNLCYDDFLRECGLTKEAISVE